MMFGLIAVALALALFAIMVGAIELGRTVGRRQLRSGGEGLAKGTGAAEGAIFALLGLLIVNDQFDHVNFTVNQSREAYRFSFFRNLQQQGALRL